MSDRVKRAALEDMSAREIMDQRVGTACGALAVALIVTVLAPLAAWALADAWPAPVLAGAAVAIAWGRFIPRAWAVWKYSIVLARRTAALHRAALGRDEAGRREA